MLQNVKLNFLSKLSKKNTIYFNPNFFIKNISSKKLTQKKVTL